MQRTFLKLVPSAISCAKLTMDLPTKLQSKLLKNETKNINTILPSMSTFFYCLSSLIPNTNTQLNFGYGVLQFDVCACKKMSK